MGAVRTDAREIEGYRGTACVSGGRVQGKFVFLRRRTWGSTEVKLGSTVLCANAFGVYVRGTAKLSETRKKNAETASILLRSIVVAVQPVDIHYLTNKDHQSKPGNPCSCLLVVKTCSLV